MSGWRARPRDRAAADPPSRRPCALRRAVARVLLALVLGAPAQCLWPPEYEVAPDLNLAVTLDPALLSEPLNVFHTWSGCPEVFTLDIEQAVSNPDGDRLFVFWFVNYQAGLVQSIDAIDTDEFVFDPCTHPKVRVGTGLPNVIEVLVLDRLPASLANADTARVIVDPETTTATATWFFHVEDTTCCTPDL